MGEIVGQNSVDNALTEGKEHAAFDGQRPDEVYFGRGEGVPDQLARRCHEARQKRLGRNREAMCSRCPRSGSEELAA